MKKAGAASVCSKCNSQYCAGKRNISDCVNDTKQDKLAREAEEKLRLAVECEEIARKKQQELKEQADMAEAERLRVEKEYAEIEYDNTKLVPPDEKKRQERLDRLMASNPFLVRKMINLEETMRQRPTLKNTMAYFEHEIKMAPLYFMFKVESDHYIHLVCIFMTFKQLENRCAGLRHAPSFPLTLITDATANIEKLVAIIEARTEHQRNAVKDLCSYIQQNRAMVEEAVRRGSTHVPNTNEKYVPCLTNLSVTCNKLADYVDTLIVDEKNKSM